MGSVYGHWNLKGKTSQDLLDKIDRVTAWWAPSYTDQSLSEGLGIGLQSNISPTKLDSPSIVHTPKHICMGDIRLDNRSEIIQRLAELNPSMSNVEIVSTLYTRHGISLVKQIIGAYVITIYDKVEQKLYVIRDQMGVKPMHYHSSENLFAFATQKKSLLTIPSISNKPNWQYLARRIENVGIQENLTEYQGILRLPPAHYIEVDRKGKSKLVEYWRLDIHKRTIYQDPNDYVEECRSLLHQSVKDRIIHLDKFGSHLSGGLDSSGITAIAANVSREIGNEIHAFSYIIPPQFENHDFVEVNENPLVRKQITYSGITNAHLIHEPLLLNRRKVIELEAEILDGYSESNNLQTETEIHTKMSELGIRVALSGFPGDELVTSFVRPYYLEYLERNQYGKYLLAKDRGKYQPSKLMIPLVAKLAQKFAGEASKKWLSKLNSKYILSFKNKNKYLSDHFYSEQVTATSSMQLALKEQTRAVHKYGFPITLREYQRNHVCRTHTNRRMESEYISGLKYNVEYRYPLADIRLLQYVMSVPMEQKIEPGGISRLLFRRSMKDIVIDDIAMRDNKKGVVRPMSMFYKKKTRKQLMTLYNYLNHHKCLDYMNLDKLTDEIKSNRLPKEFGQYLMVGYLIHLNKLSL